MQSSLVQGYGGSVRLRFSEIRRNTNDPIVQQLFASDNGDAVASAPHILIVGFLIQIVSFGIFGMFALVCTRFSQRVFRVQGLIALLE